ncbi:MAG: hypothetical protein AAB268_09250 [Elusimicrobiota bacterium]
MSPLARLLTEVSENMGWRRKHAIRAMNGKIVNSDKLTDATVKRPPRLSSNHAAAIMPTPRRRGNAVIHRMRKAAHSYISQRFGGGASMGRA